MILRLLGWQGIAGLTIACALALLLVVQKGETRHWRREAGRYEQLGHAAEAALAGTVANYRAAAERARADQAASARAAAQQHAINERTADDYQARLAAARARAQRLRVQDAGASSDPGGRAAAPVPGLSAASGGAAQGPGEKRLPDPEHRPQAEVVPLGADDALIATEQAIQLDELIKWVERQHRVDPNAPGH